MPQGISTFKNVFASAACLKERGHDFVIRYYSSSAWKRLTAPEAQAIFQAGLQLVIVFENGPSGDEDTEAQYQKKVAYFTTAQGSAHGAGAYAYARDVIRQPAGSAIYFAVDFDVRRDEEIAANIKDYFEAVKVAFAQAGGGYRIAVYGSGAVCRWLKDHGQAELTWLAESTGWRDSDTYKESGDWDLLQTSLNAQYCGLVAHTHSNDSEFEINESSGTDFGAFGPAAESFLLRQPQMAAMPSATKGRKSAKKGKPAQSPPATLTLESATAADARSGAAMPSFLRRLEAAERAAPDGPHGSPVNNAEAYLNLWSGRRGEHEFVKIIAIRGGYNSSGNQLGLYDDQIVVCIGTELTEWRGSTDPGQYYLDNPINADGCAQLCEGIHYFKTGIHQGSYPAFVQAESFHVNRLNSAGVITQVQFGDFGIHLHSGGTGINVGEFSAGCQIIQCPEGYFGATWNQFYSAITSALNDARQTLLPYMLISRED